MKDSPGIKTQDNAIRYIDSYQGLNMYTTVGDKEGNGKPFSIMTSISDQSINTDLDRLSMIDTITILASMALRAYPVEKVIRNIERGSRMPSTFPGIIARRLKETVEEWDK